VMSNISKDVDSVKNYFFKINKFATYLSLLVLSLCIVFSKQVVLVAYGSKFLDAVPILIIFSIASIVASPFRYFELLAIINGKTNLSFYALVYRLFVAIIIVSLCSLVSIEMVAYGQILISIAMIIISWKVIVARMYNFSFKEFYKTFSASVYVCFFITITMAPVVCNNLFHINSMIVGTIIYLVIFAVAYAVSIRLFLKTDVDSIKSIAVKMFYHEK
jgi:O-antigen/teichoic acid export membrane protein